MIPYALAGMPERSGVSRVVIASRVGRLIFALAFGAWFLSCVLTAFVTFTGQARAQAAATESAKAERKAALLRELEAVQAELRKLDGLPPNSVAQFSQPTSGSARQDAVPEVVVRAPVVPSVSEAPASQTITTLEREKFDNSQAFSIGQVLQTVPGVEIKQGNGPRDVGISVRGSNARNGFGIRNVVIYDDGFPVTQPDGLSRSDLIDPHSYSGIDVYKGPSSSLFGNYATGGAINFRSRRGGDINGFEVGSDAGSFGYFNEYLAFGRKLRGTEYSLFGSYVRGNGHIANSNFVTATESALVTFNVSPNDTLTFKVLNNDVDTKLSIRLNRYNWQTNPFQRGCTAAVGRSDGCATLALLTNGFTGATTTQTAEQAGLGRSDRRTIVGARWEHAIDNQTTWRSQFVFDNRDINQPTGTTSAVGTVPSYNFISDVTQSASLFGMDATHFIGMNLNYLDNHNDTFNVMPGSSTGAITGGLTANTSGHQSNAGIRAREELKINSRWTAVAGIGAEWTNLGGVQTNYTYAAAATPTITKFGIGRNYSNIAPEIGVQYLATNNLLLRSRASMGYGTPSLSNLTTTSAGTPGNNTNLNSQTNLGIDIGADWNPLKTLGFTVTGFYEFFQNEIIAQSPGTGFSSYSFNAPRTEHRGVELATDWKPFDGWRMTAAYVLNDQRYTTFVETLSNSATIVRQYDRTGNKIPGVEPHFATVRLGYDQPYGQLAGLGAYAEGIWKDGYAIDNANQVYVPSYGIMNLNLHYDPSISFDWLKGMRFFFEVQNVFDKVYVASANNLTNKINANGTQLADTTAATGSIYAGAPRTFIGGGKLRF